MGQQAVGQGALPSRACTLALDLAWVAAHFAHSL